MSAGNKNITDMPYAQWLEQTLRDISDLDVRSIAFSGVLESGDVYTAYYNAQMTDKLVLAGIINQDAMMDTLEANGVIEYEEDDEEEEDVEEKE